MIVTAKITKINKHPNATKLQVCTVNDGTEELQVVCGAKNAREGMITILAKIGSKTPKSLEIKKSNLRGQDSYGMLCSPGDLKVSEESGIIDLPPDTDLGKDYKEIPQTLLSSTPWFLYQLVDRHFEKDGKISITKTKAPGKLIAETYWDGSQYLYRDFL